MRDSIERVVEYTSGGRDSFFNDTLIQDAVARNLAILGEAAKKINEETRQLAPDVAWKQMAGMRDVLIHDYVGIDLGLVWNVVEHELPKVADEVDRLLSDTNRNR